VNNYIKSKRIEALAGSIANLGQQSLRKLELTFKLFMLNIDIKAHLDAQMVNLSQAFLSTNRSTSSDLNDMIVTAENTHHDWKGLVLLAKSLLPEALEDIFDDAQVLNKNPDASESSWLYSTGKDKGRYVSVRIER
jgi:hypothetical protein